MCVQEMDEKPMAEGRRGGGGCPEREKKEIRKGRREREKTCSLKHVHQERSHRKREERPTVWPRGSTSRKPQEAARRRPSSQNQTTRKYI